ncbi:NIPA-like protein 3 [Apophysomyces sp. BC1034]|nr:NIPA-like protein 3 [Apophysomyces sp. BC1021]KAG0184955.1 NIPA-like protein 3 [Apophysomyces sp. BC1034]
MDEPPRWISATSNHYDQFFPDDGYSSPRTSEDIPRSEAEELEHQKLIMAMAQEQTRGGDSDYLRSKLWWLGISLMILGEIGNFVAYGFAPASTIAPLGTATLVSNVILAPLMLKEVFRKRDLLGVVLAVMGAAMVVLSSNAEEGALSPESVMEALTQTRAIVYFCTTGIAIATLTILSPLYGSSSIMIDLGLVAIYGGYTVLCTKSVASLLSLTLFNMFAYPVSYILILTLVVTAILQIKYLNKALQRFDSTEVIPTQFVLFTISAIIGSAVLYHDFDNMGMEQTSRFMTGCAVEFLGVYLITSKRNKDTSLSLSIRADDTPDTQISISADESHPQTSTEHNQTDYSHQQVHFGQFPRRAHADNRASVTFKTPTQLEDWQGNTKISHHRRRSSVFRGISLTSQLVDRMNDDVVSQPVQLPASPTRQAFQFTGRKRDSALGSLLNGLTGLAHEPILHTSEADAIEIEIPTASTLISHRDTSLDDEELVPIVQRDTDRRNSARLLEIEGSAEHRDLS